MANPSKAKGSRFERLIADYLSETFPCERIPAGATVDRGDLWTPTGVTLQLKDHARLAMGPAWAATLDQQANNGHDLSFLVHKRHGKGAPGDQWVTCDVTQLRRLLAERVR